MAVDKLVDSTQLDADLTSVANAIRTKGGTSAQMAFPAGFVSAVEAIPTGSGSEYLPFQYLTQLNHTFGPNNTWRECVPSPMELYLPNCENVCQAFIYAQAFDGEDLVVILHFNENAPTVTNMAQAFIRTEIVEAKITGNLSGVTSYSNFIVYNAKIKKIDAELDFSSVTTDANSNFGGGGVNTLTYLRYKPNTLSVNHGLTGQHALDEDSLVSIANGLNESATGKTLTLYSTRKALCDTIMGTVGMDATNTFHVFTKDSSGSVTLTDFITNTKGWTLA